MEALNWMREVSYETKQTREEVLDVLREEIAKMKNFESTTAEKVIKLCRMTVDIANLKQKSIAFDLVEIVDNEKLKMKSDNSDEICVADVVLGPTRQQSSFSSV